jgi:hypothetical protein
MFETGSDGNCGQQVAFAAVPQGEGGNEGSSAASYGALRALGQLIQVNAVRSPRRKKHIR